MRVAVAGFRLLPLNEDDGVRRLALQDKEDGGVGRLPIDEDGVIRRTADPPAAMLPLLPLLPLLPMLPILLMAATLLPLPLPISLLLVRVTSGVAKIPFGLAGLPSESDRSSVCLRSLTKSSARVEASAENLTTSIVRS